MAKHKDYNRYKYYDRLRTNFIEQMSANGDSDANDDYPAAPKFMGDFLRPPSHVID